MSDIFGFSVTSAALVLSALGLWFPAIMPGIDRWSKRFFQCYFAVFILCCVFSLADLLLFGRSISHAAVYLLMFLECLFLSLPLPMLTVYLLRCCGETMRRSRLFRAVLGLWAVYVVLLASAELTGVFIYDPADNYNYRGPLYPLLLLPLVVILLLNLASVVRWRSRLSRPVFQSFLIAIVPMTAALLAQMFVDVLPLVDIGFIVSALAMYGLILSDQIERYLHQQREIADQRASIAVLQMRPHFIYNTLMAIYSLCNQDPQKARQVTMDFTNYLRKNFNAVASENPIPFSAELEHTRAYLAVEQAQFEEMLLVEYDVLFTNFRVPPLTLQPIVENAVKHGMNPYAGPLHVRIQTRHTDSGSVITVEDTGPGFEKRKSDVEPHIALDNIRERLEMMCRGTLEIAPRDGGGTMVTVTIPDRNAEG